MARWWVGGGGGQTDCGSYVPRAPLGTSLHWAVREGLPDFLEAAEAAGGLPAYILKEFNAYLSCGDLSRGFVRVLCPGCDIELRVGFSCKGRNVCPSCGAKRAALAGAQLVDEVLPRVPWRQWTLAFPRGLKLALAIDAKLLSAALRAFIGAIFAFQRRRAKQLGIDAQTRLPLGEEPPRRVRRCAFLEGSRCTPTPRCMRMTGRASSGWSAMAHVGRSRSSDSPAAKTASSNTG